MFLEQEKVDVLPLIALSQKPLPISEENQNKENYKMNSMMKDRTGSRKNQIGSSNCAIETQG
jgi:hypothetical protein